MGLLKSKSKTPNMGLSVADFFWSTCLVAPLVVAYWRGTWDLLEDWVYPDPVPESVSDSLDSVKSDNEDSDGQGFTWYRQLTGITCYLLGLIVRIGMDMALYHVKEFVEGRTRLLRVTLSWIYIAVYAIAGVAFWRGIWTLMTRDIGLGTVQLLVILVTGLVLTLVMKAGKSLLATPVVLTLDKHEEIFANGNYFKKTPADKGWFVMDVLFTNLIMRHLVIFSWWSLWELENQFLQVKLIGEEDKYVAVDSLLMGYSAFIITYALDYLSQNMNCTKLYITKPLYIFTILLGHFATVNVWRGLWSMLDHFFLPGINHDENYIISHLVSLLLISLAMVSTSISNDSIILDHETDNIVCIRYWGNFDKNREESDEMTPIVE